ncbi:MAG: radical SAM family heme chaperone HemW [Clostridia bacterium]|nr:radical SAM family heme chaperone HemW [Clostridia bacterium]
MRRIGLYIHIPFCVKKCNYCDFYSLPHSKEKEELYISALCKHIEKEKHLYDNCEFDTVYIGGGTPSILSKSSVIRLVGAVKKHLNTTQGGEFTIELNPCTITKEKLLTYKELGINRLSIGVQSANDKELKCLGRAHTSKEAFEKFNLARECGFNNISLDVMFSLPNQKISDFQKTLDYVCGFSPEHISAYGLKIEENTPFGKNRDKLSLPSEDEDYDMYMCLCDTLSKNGYEQYEISNFSKRGYRSRHNMKYWLCQEYVGFGPSSHSYFDGVRYYYDANFQKYIDGSSERIMETVNDAETTLADKMDEYVMLRLRLSDGVDEGEFFKAFNKSFLDEYPKLKDFLKNGYVVHQDGHYSFTRRGYFVSNYILSEILH